MKKKATQYDIADALGISRTTVARAINNSPKIKQETKDLVYKTAEKLGYKVNPAAIMLSKKNPVKISVILVKAVNIDTDQYFIQGMETAKKEFPNLNIELDIHLSNTEKIIDQKIQLKTILNSNPKPQGIILMPIFQDVVEQELIEINNRNIPLIILNTDTAEDYRISFVGEDSYRGGLILGDLAAKYLRYSGNILTVTPSLYFKSAENRIKGFKESIKNYKKIKIIKNIKPLHISETYEKVHEYLLSKPNFDAVFTTVDTLGVAKALNDASYTDKILLTFDYDDNIKYYLENGTIDTTLYQRPNVQGYLALKRIINYIIYKKEAEKLTYVGYDIMTIANNAIHNTLR
jgi:LacI family transcriptional regulator